MDMSFLHKNLETKLQSRKVEKSTKKQNDFSTQPRKEDIGSLLTGEPREGGIPIPKILNVSVTKYENHSKIEVSSFHKMYEVYTLVCNLTNDDTDSLVKELNNSDVRISFS